MPAEKLKIEIVHSANHHQLGGAKNDNLHAPRTGHRHQQKKVLYWMLGCAEKHTSNILFVVIKYIYKKPPKRIIPTKV